MGSEGGGWGSEGVSWGVRTRDTFETSVHVGTGAGAAGRARTPRASGERLYGGQLRGTSAPQPLVGCVWSSWRARGLTLPHQPITAGKARTGELRYRGS
jgi:hypothetical protein